jgi:hypothetical protein
MLYWVLVSFRLSLLISPKIGFRYHAFGIVSCMLYVNFYLREILAPRHPMGYDSIKQNGPAETRGAPTVSLQSFPVCLIPPRTCTPHPSVLPCPTPAAPSPWLPPLSLSAWAGPKSRDEDEHVPSGFVAFWPFWWILDAWLWTGLCQGCRLIYPQRSFHT